MEAVSTRLEAARADLMSSRTDFDNSEQGVALARRAETPKNWWGRMHGSPLFQVVILGLILFLNPGLFNAVTSVGGAGLRDAKLASDSLTALYACFAVSGLLGGSVANYLGLRATLCIGSTGYSLYIAALLTSHIVGPKVDAFVITAGCILGITAGLLWTAYGTLILSLPTESQKGVWLSIPWALFNLGDVIGAALLLGETSDRSQGSVSTAGYSVVLGLTFLAIFLPWAMMPPRKITRSDGTRVITPRHPTFVSELKGLVHCFWSDPIFLLMVPFFFISNSFYAYHFNCFNLGLFSIRSRALNSLLYWIAQAMTAPLLGLILDSPRFSRRTRAKIGFCIVLALVMVVWGPTYHIQHSFSRENPKRLDYEELQMGKAYYAGVSILYFFCGVCDSSWQLYAYWVMGALSNNPRRLAYYNSLYKGLQSAGNAVFWRLDSYGVPFMTMLVATWASLGASLVLAAPMIIFRIRDFTTTDVRIVETEEQLDETTYTTIGTMENAHPSGETISLEDHHLRQRGASRFAADDEDDKALSKLETIEETPSVLARQASAAHPSSSFYEDKVIREEEEEEENAYPDANTRPH